MNENEKNLSTSTNSTEQFVQEKRTDNKSNTKLVIITIIVLLLIALSGVLIYLKITDSKNKFKALINESFTYLEDNIKDSKTTSGTFGVKVNGNSKDEDANNTFKIINKLNLSGTYGIDYEQKIIDLKLNTKYGSDKLINTNFYTADKNAYIYLEDIYDKYLKIEIPDYDSIFASQNQKDIKIILTSLNKALDTSLKDEYFTKEKAQVNSIKTTKTTLKLNKENMDSIKKDLVKILKNDNEFLQSLSQITDKKVEEIKEALDKLKDESISELDVSLYTKGLKNDFVRLEIANGKEYARVTKEDQKYNYEITDEGKVVYSGYLSQTTKKDNTTYQFNLEDKEGDNKINITFNSNTKYNNKITKQDVSNNINYENLTEEDYQKITSSLLENKNIMKLMQDISSLNPSLNLS